MTKYILTAIVLLFILFFQSSHAEFKTMEAHNTPKVFKLDNDYTIELIEQVIDKKVARFLVLYNNDTPVMMKSCQEPKILNETDKQICNIERITL